MSIVKDWKPGAVSGTPPATSSSSRSRERSAPKAGARAAPIALGKKAPQRKGIFHRAKTSTIAHRGGSFNRFLAYLRSKTQASRWCRATACQRDGAMKPDQLLVTGLLQHSSKSVSRYRLALEREKQLVERQKSPNQIKISIGEDNRSAWHAKLTRLVGGDRPVKIPSDVYPGCSWR